MNSVIVVCCAADGLQ